MGTLLIPYSTMYFSRHLLYFVRQSTNKYHIILCTLYITRSIRRTEALSFVREPAQVEQFGDLVREAEMLWTCAEETQWAYWTKNLQQGAARKEEKRNIKEKVHE